MRGDSRRNGFTLIELLVVMAVIMLLAGISMPVFHRFRASGYTLKCAAQLRAIGSAFYAYQTHYGGWMPHICEETGVQERNTEYRHADKAVSWKYELSFILYDLPQHQKDRKRFCLSDHFFDPKKGTGQGNYFVAKKQFGSKLQVKTWDPDTHQKVWRDYYDYTNISAHRSGGVDGKVVAEIWPKGYMPYKTWKAPSRAAIVGPSVSPTLQRGLAKIGDQVNIEYRHLGQANILFLDGSVKQFSEGDEQLFELFDKKIMEKAELIGQLD